MTEHRSTPPPHLEDAIVDRLRAEGWITGPAFAPPARSMPGRRRLSYRWLAAAAALVAAFGLGFGAGRRALPEVEIRSQALPEDNGGVAARVEPARVIQFHEDGTDPFLHYSDAEEHPSDLSVLVKTWEY